MASDGIPRLIAFSLYKVPSFFDLFKYGVVPPVKNNLGAFFCWKRDTPEKNLSGSFHSWILASPGTLGLPPLLRTTIASAIGALVSLIRFHGYSTNFHSKSATKPILKVHRNTIRYNVFFLVGFLRMQNRKNRLKPSGRINRGINLLRKYVAKVIVVICSLSIRSFKRLFASFL